MKMYTWFHITLLASERSESVILRKNIIGEVWQVGEVGRCSCVGIRLGIPETVTDGTVRKKARGIIKNFSFLFIKTNTDREDILKTTSIKHNEASHKNVTEACTSLVLSFQIYTAFPLS